MFAATELTTMISPLDQSAGATNNDLPSSGYSPRVELRAPPGWPVLPVASHTSSAERPNTAIRISLSLACLVMLLYDVFLLVVYL
jgi:hypothetical protein